MMTMNKSRWLKVAGLCVALIVAYSGPSLHAAEMQNYCAVPPYITNDVAPNIMILMDNSTDMYKSAYCNDTTNSPQICTDTYTPNATKDNYIGYFLPQSCYTYSGNKFVEVAKTGSITCTTANCYTSYTYADTCPASAPFRGNLMNWATMSKYDVLEKVIIGGNSVSKQSNANTLLSIGAAWQKTYNGCIFNVSNAGLEITETVVGACALLDPAAGFAYLPGQTMHYAKARTGSWMDNAYTTASTGINGLAGFALSALDELNPVSTAWAATGVGIQTGSLSGTMGSTYSITFECTGTGSDCPNGTYVWTVTSKPAWLTVTTYASSGSKNNYRMTLSGDPTGVGSFGPFTVSFTVGTKSASASYTITISGGALGIISGSLPDGVVGGAYSTTVTGKGGTTCGAVTDPYTWQYQWSATGLPPGLSIGATTGVISGTPTTAGTYSSVDITMTDCTATPGSVTKRLSLTVAAPSLSISTQTLPNGTISSAYSSQLTAYGSSGYTWSITSGYLPFGLFLDPSTGIISGNTCPFTSAAATAATPGYGTGSGPGVRAVGYDGVTPVAYLKTDPFSVISGHNYLVSTCPADGGTYTGDPFLQLTGIYNYYQDDSCSLAPRINFSAGSSGVESVKQSTYGANVVPATSWSYNIKDLTDNKQCQDTFNFTVSVLDSLGTTTTKNYTIIIGGGGLSIDSNSLPVGVKNQAYGYPSTSPFQVLYSGGTGPYTWSATGLPASLSINTSTGQISGTPGATDIGTYTVTITLRDSTLTTVSKTFTLSVLASYSPRTSSFNVKVDIVEEPLTDVNGNDAYDPNTTETFTDLNGNGSWDGKKGVFQKYWDVNLPKARWGLTDFTNQGVQIEACIPASPASSFYTRIQNATPNTTAPLADALYGDLNYYGFATANFSPYDSASYRGCNTSDPIDNVSCRKNFVLIISSGADVTGENFDTNPAPLGTAFPSATTFAPAGTTVGGQCSIVRDANKTQPLVLNACYAFLNDMRTDRTKKQQVFTYAVHTMGTAASGQILEDAATAGGGNYYDASSTSDLEEQLDKAFKDMLARATSGTAASVLASGEGSGANLIQAVFYPKRKYGTTEIDWIGRLTNLWYYVDPLFANSSIREDDGDKVLTLKTAPTGTHTDYIVTLAFDGEQTLATRATDTNGDGAPDGAPAVAVEQMEDIGNLWEAGTLLWERDPATRTLYTSTTGNSIINFSTANAATLAPYMNMGTAAAASDLITWVRGADVGAYRTRAVKIDLNKDGDTLDIVNGYDESIPRVWKLGDVLNSTPKISSWIPLNGYHKINRDSTYGVPGEDPSLTDPANASTFITSSIYKSRGMVFAGANDGMLHAFKLGTLELKWAGQDVQFEKARLTGSGLGSEVWAFIPKNVLPYLQYVAQPGYCHVYSVDLTPYLFDASIGAPGSGETANTTKTAASWRTIIIGGMRYGGACKPKDDACATNTPNSVCAPAEVSGTSIGYSSYFALDVTDQSAPPVLLWEFTAPDLGFTTGGPAVVRISAKTGGIPDNTKNGNWFVVLASGPTGPISADGQFMGASDQPLKIYVLNLKDGTVAATPTVPADITYAFGGSLYNATMDTDNPPDYQDDVIYIPYVKKAADNTWTDGGILRLSTGENETPSGNWTVSKVMSGIGPVTSAITKLKNNRTNTLWLFFGAGRYYFQQSGTADDSTKQRQIFGLKEPCVLPDGTFDGACTTEVSFCATPCTNPAGTPVACSTPAMCGALTNVTDVTQSPTNPDVPTDPSDPSFFRGWYINLDADETPDTRFRAERIITDPLATSTGVVFFTSYKPYSSECELGGESSIWAVKYNSGGSASSLLQGKALIQVSTGSIEQINLADAFTNAGNRKTGQIQGVPPTAQGLSILAPPKPVKRVLHVRER